MVSEQKLKIPTEKNFGITFSIFFFILFILFLAIGKTIIFLLVVSIINLLLAYFVSDILRVPNYIWYKFGKLISIITNPLIMFILYYFLFTPYGFIIRLFKKQNTGWYRYISDDNFDNQF